MRREVLRVIQCKGGNGMKKLVLSVLFILIVAVNGLAHEGTLGLYVDETLNDCDATLGVAVFDLNLYYWRDQGFDLGNACEFRMVITSPLAFFQEPTWADNIEVTIGSIVTGISLTGSTCLGSAMDIVYLGTIPVFNVGDMDTFFVRVVNHPTSYPNPSIYVTVCDPFQTKREVLGGWFVFNGTCNVESDPKSWGAIKNLYR